jgi:threonyl-tRNA synthetase
MEQQKQDSLYKLRHSLAHVLAEAIIEIRPTAKLAFGPPVDDGCYYDFLFETPLTPEDFKDIEKRMRKIIGRREKFEGTKLPADQALTYLESTGQYFKVEYAKELIAGGETEIGFYENGPFKDMCAGPHLEHTGQIPPDCFLIDSLAGAYWRGSEKNPQLTRLYVLAFENKDKLSEYVKARDLAKERDHRKLGKELELFIFADEIGPGLPMWTPNGTAIRDALEDFAKDEEARLGYVRVSTPHIAKEDLYKISGHLPYYKDSMFPPMTLEGESNYYLKAMNCPHHHILFKHRPRSYRELPLRFAEYGEVYRFESSGSLCGLLRVRCMCMNDAHIYCAPEQLKPELLDTFKLVLKYFNKFRFTGVRFRYSTHSTDKPEKYVDDPTSWEYTERLVKESLDELGVDYFVGPGEAAFYGPKIDFQAKSVIGREETISTTQLDFAQPKRFGLTFIGQDGKEHMPYVVHRAPLGTHERFISFLIEHFGGAFPTWMAPTQVRVIPVSTDAGVYSQELFAKLRNELVRVEIDDSDNSFNKKIREAVTAKTPIMAIVGQKEAAERTVTIRRYCTKEQITVPESTFITMVTSAIKERKMDNFADVAL